MDWDEITNLVSIYNSDIRRVLQILQFWVNSGGGQKVRRSVKERRSEIPQELVTQLPVIDENSQDATSLSKRGTRAVISSLQDDDDDDFVSIKPITSRKHQIVSDDESSNPPLTVEESVLLEAQQGPSVNVGCLESMLGLPIRNEGGVLGFLQKMLQVLCLGSLLIHKYVRCIRAPVCYFPFLGNHCFIVTKPDTVSMTL